MKSEDKTGGREPQLSREFLLGQLKAALRPSQVSLDEVRRLLRVIALMGYNVAEMYMEAAEDRPEVYDPVPLLAKVAPKESVGEKHKELDLSRGEVGVKPKPTSQDLKAVTSPRVSKVPVGH
jgi:hypothetical protein